MEIKQLITAIQEALTPDLLKKKYRTENKNNPMFGHCYGATEALYYLLKEYDESEKHQDFKPCRGRDQRGIVHWWLQDDHGGILDPTSEQYTKVGLKPPYEKGRRGGFLTKEPSKRASTVILRVKKASRL